MQKTGLLFFCVCFVVIFGGRCTLVMIALLFNRVLFYRAN